MRSAASCSTSTATTRPTPTCSAADREPTDLHRALRARRLVARARRGAHRVAIPALAARECPGHRAVTARTIRIGSTPCDLAPRPAARLFVLLGPPVAHSRSPRMQAAAFAAAGIAATYVACDVAPRRTRATRSRRCAGSEIACGGANVTVPHKQAGLRHWSTHWTRPRREPVPSTRCVAFPAARGWIGHQHRRRMV